MLEDDAAPDVALNHDVGRSAARTKPVTLTRNRSKSAAGYSSAVTICWMTPHATTPDRSTLYRGWLCDLLAIRLRPMTISGPCSGSGEGREKKRSTPNLAPGAPFIGATECDTISL